MDDRPWFKSYDPGVPHHIDVPPIPLHRFLEQAAKDYPGRACAVFKGRAVTYAEMDELSDRLAGGLAALGVKQGAPVGIFMPNSAQFVMAFYAILKAGGVVVATNPLYSGREIEHQLNDAGIEIMLVMSNFYNTIKRVQPKTRLRRVLVTNIKEYLPPLMRTLFTLVKEKKGGHRVTLAEGDSRDDVPIEWSQPGPGAESGGGRGALSVQRRDHRVVEGGRGDPPQPGGQYAANPQLDDGVPRRPGDRLDGDSDVPRLRHGCRDVVCRPQRRLDGDDPQSAGPEGRPREHRPLSTDGLPGVPTMYNAINNNPQVAAGKYKLSSIKACISGSAPLLRETKDRFEALTGGKLVEGFGLSEAPTATHCNPLLGENRSGSIGLPFPDVDCRIVSLDDGATVLGVDEIGELALRSPNVMRGYHNMPTETANALRDGWLFTGDIARMDADGYFYIVDRKKELIKPGGFQVWPREVEEEIAKNPKVLDVGVAGIPDAYRGETVKAWVVVRPGETLTEDEVRAWCKERMATFKVPTQVEFRDELPKTTVGKILRRELVRQDKEKQPA
jgi:long-chain acyl-CoA synthetase